MFKKVNPITSFVIALTVAVLFVVNIVPLYIATKTSKAASPFSIDSEAQWDEGTFTTTESNTGTLNLTSESSWYNSTAPTFYDFDYSYQRTITFDNSDQSEDLTNFPVMLKLTDDELNWSSIVQADLDDVIFVDSDNSTLLSWEWETKLSTGESITWVKVPTIDQSSSTDFIYMYYGNAGATDQSDGEGVWSQDFEVVYHMTDATTTTILDSTSNSNDATKRQVDGPAQTTGKIGYGQDFTGVSYLKNDSTAGLPSGNVSKTLETWFKYSGCIPAAQILGGFGTNGVGQNFQIEVCNSSEFWVMGWGVDWQTGISTASYLDGEWHHIAVTYDGTTATMILDGGAATASTSSYAFNTSTSKIMVGEEIDEGGRPYESDADEFRISSISRSADWVAATYLSESNSFTTLSAPETGTSYTYRRKITFDNANQSTDLTDFPVMINATEGDLSWSSKVQSDLDDVVFVDSDNSTLLSHEWDIANSSGTSIAYVKVPQIDQSSDTDHIYMYYGNDTATNLEYGEGVWTNGAAGVWTMNEGSGATVYDKTRNNNDGTLTNMDPATDWVGTPQGWGLDFDAIDDWVYIGSAWDDVFTDGLSVVAVVRFATNGQTRIMSINSNADSAYDIWMQKGGSNKLEFGAGSGAKYITTDATLPAGQWYTIAGVTRYTDQSTALYVDGAAVAAGVIGTPSYTPNLGAGSIGRLRSSGTWYYTGALELALLMIYDRALSADEIAASYLSGMNTFNTIATETIRYSFSGSYTSTVHDMTYNSILSLLSSTETLNSGTTIYSIRTGPTSSVGSGWTDWTTTTNNADPATSLDNNRYAQIKIELTGSGSATPDVSSLSLTYAEVPAIGGDTTTPTTSTTTTTSSSTDTSTDSTISTSTTSSNPDDPIPTKEEVTIKEDQTQEEPARFKFILITTSSLLGLGALGFVIRALMIPK